MTVGASAIIPKNARDAWLVGTRRRRRGEKEEGEGGGGGVNSLQSLLAL